MAAGTWQLTNQATEYIGDNTWDMDGDTFAAVLLSSSSNIAATSTTYAGLTGELTTQFGYTSGGATLAGVTWTRSAGVTTFDFTDPSWTAAGGTITARWCAIRNVTAADVVCFALLDDTPADVSAIDGNPFTVELAATGCFDHTTT